jgi:hypothetical protein
MPTISTSKNVYRKLREINFQDHSKPNSAGDPSEKTEERQERMKEIRLREQLTECRNKLASLKVVINHLQRKFKTTKDSTLTIEILTRLNELRLQREQLQQDRQKFAGDLGGFITQRKFKGYSCI